MRTNDPPLQRPNVMIRPPDVTLQPTDVTLRARDVTLQPLDGTLQTVNATLQSGDAALQMADATLQMPDVTFQRAVAALQTAKCHVADARCNVALGRCSRPVPVRKSLSDGRLDGPPPMEQLHRLLSRHPRLLPGRHGVRRDRCLQPGSVADRAAGRRRLLPRGRPAPACRRGSGKDWPTRRAC
jgi:hypothetical protein